jgi:hypothetical protein
MNGLQRLRRTTRGILENRVEQKALQIKRQMEQEGYNEFGYFALYSPWDDLVPWKAILVAKKKRWLGSADEKQMCLALARNPSFVQLEGAYEEFSARRW